MLEYRYLARNPATGQQVKAIVEAQNEQAAAKAIRSEGLVPIDIALKGSTGMFKGLTKYLNRVKTKDTVLFARQLSTLINAGLPLVQSLRNVAEQTTSKPLKAVINNIISNVEGGQSLSDSLSKHPDVFNRIFVSLVAAGESSGTLDTSLERVAIQQEKDADIISKIRGAMVYPIVVLLVMVGVVTFMLVKVLPQVKVLYQTFPGANLPIETRMLLAVSHFVTQYWWIVLLLAVIAIVATTRWIQTGPGRRFFDMLKLRTPPFAKLFQKVYMARFSRTGSTLVGAGVPLLQMLQIAANAVSNVLVQDSISKAAEKVKGGKALSDSLQGDPNFLSLVPNMLRIGEQSGSMEQMMTKTAEYYEKEVDNEIKNISTLLEPIMMVLLGIMALIIVAAVLLPIYGLAASGAVSNGGV